ncbi:MAG: [Clostridia bacterium]|nr:[FeFe] hydrogenase H-cluster maturation GTPase HydF [Clostridia bacterium]
MSLNSVVSAERLHIAFFGRRNAGKSSLVNAVTNQSLSVVSDTPGTTTDPVKKAMELLPLGPVQIIDTPGFDDVGTLGELRVQKTRQVLAGTDVAVLVLDAAAGKTDADRELETIFAEKRIPFLTAYNKADLLESRPDLPPEGLYTSAVTREGVEALKERIGALGKDRENKKHIVSDLLSPGDHAVLVIPIDESAPKGRLILPQQQTMRDLLDAGCTFSVCQPPELPAVIGGLKKPPALVVTDSQAFEQVARLTPPDVRLTSFSILFARYKGELAPFLEGAAALKALAPGDRVLISEGCTHHRQCNDIGTVKLPGWIRDYSGTQDLVFDFTSGGDFPADLSPYRLVVHCGGCMLSEREMLSRLEHARRQGVPVVNYGIAIAEMHGILQRSVAALVR